MTEAIITGVVAIIVCFVNNIYQTNKMRNLMDYRLTQLEIKVEKHNNLIERTYELEKNEDILEHRVYHLENRIRMEDEIAAKYKTKQNNVAES